MKTIFVLLAVVFLANVACTTSRLQRCSTPKLANGKMRFRQRSRFVKYSCNVGYLLFGDRYSTCVYGKWDSPPPKCVRAGCRKVNTPNNGLIYPSHMNAVLHFYCKSGYNLRGSNATYCNGTTWSSNMPICLQSNTKPSLSCDFEKDDLCGWTHDLNHDFDWRRMQFGTPSGAIGTGPLYDHTLGEDRGGFYMYIESSSRNENDTARLISPVYDKTDNATCFEFFYHMYGNTIGTLRAYMKMVNETWDLNRTKAFFDKHGNQGDKWLRFIYSFGAIPNDYQIIIEGVRGNGYVSDIAIDDVRVIQNCNYNELLSEEQTTTEWDTTGTTDFLPDDVFSCENKCFSTEIQIGKHRTCACDVNCYERNNCCPDFIDYCLLRGPSTDFEDTSSSTATTAKLTTITTRRTTPTMTTRTTPTMTIRTTPTMRTRRTTTTTSTTIRETTTTTEPTTTEQDELCVTGNEVWPQTETELSNEIPQIPDRIAPPDAVADLKEKYKEKIVIEQEEPTDRSLFYLTTGGAVLIVVIAALLLVTKRKHFSQRHGRGLRATSHGDSASDVRFLTHDELLDLNLVYE